MPFVAVGPSVRPGTVVATPLSHASLLAFTDDALGIANTLARQRRPRRLHQRSACSRAPRSHLMRCVVGAGRF